MNTAEHLIMCLAEECAEVIQVCSKINRFGLENGYPEDGPTNEERLSLELNDLLSIIQLLKLYGIDIYGFKPSNNKHVDDKIEKVAKYMNLARKLGTLEDT